MKCIDVYYFRFQGRILLLLQFHTMYLYIAGIDATLNPKPTLNEGTSISCSVGGFWAVFRRFGRILGCF